MFTRTLATIGLYLALILGARAAADVDIVRPTCTPRKTTDYFFPPGSLELTGDDSFRRRWYSSHLRAMREPSLSCGNWKDGFRFTWLRAFHHPVAIRVDIDRKSGKHTLTAVELTGAGGYSPGTVKRRRSRVLKAEEVARWQQAVIDSQVWSAPRQVEDSGFDGSEWILESREGNSYRVVRRWSPDDGPVRRIGLLFISLSGWEFPETY